MLSIVTTLYRSAAHVEAFHRRASEAAAAVSSDYEIVMVDDGSPDDALARALALVETDPHVRVVELSRNFGHHRAMMTGLDHARGDLVFLIDVDLEEDPAWLGTFLAIMTTSGVDVVYGYQERRKGGLMERAGGALHWWLIRRLSPYPIPENLVTARLMKRDYVQALLRHREQNTAIGGLWAITGFRQTGTPVVKGHRGGSSYSLGRRIAVGFDGITAFSERPLILVFLLGLAIFLLAFSGGAWLVLWTLLGANLLSGWASMIVSIWMLGGLTIASIGLLGLYIARIFIETKQRPYTIVRAVHPRDSGETR